MIPTFEGARIFVVGDLILDSFTYCRRTRTSSEDGRAFCVDVVKHELQIGGAGNAARCVRALGGSPAVFAVSGAGYHARKLNDALVDAGVDSALVRTDERPTTYKDRNRDVDTGELLLVVERQDRSPIPTWVGDGLLGRFASAAATRPHVVLVSDYDRGVVTEHVAKGVSRLSQKWGIPLIVDARERPLAWYKQAFKYLSLLTPNRRELSKVVGRELNTSAEIDTAAREVAEALDCDVLVTLSEQGARLYTRDGRVHRFDAKNGRPVSVSGGGDALVAAISVCLAKGILLAEACEIAQHAAAVCVGKPGTDVCSYAELLAHIESHPPRSKRSASAC